MILASLLSWLWRRPPPGTPPVPSLPPLPSPLPRSPAEAARRAACQSWTRAQEAVNRELGSFEEWDQRSLEGPAGVGRERWRQQLMARDRSGELRHARAAALRAERLARTVGDTYEAAKLLARIECDLGHHPAELQQVRILMRLAPQQRVSLAMPQHAAECNGLKALWQQASRALAALDARHLLPYQARHSSPPRLIVPPTSPLRRQPSPSAAVLREAQEQWRRALRRVNPELETLAAEAPDAAGTPEEWRRQVLARDPGSHLHQALLAGRRAEALARTTAEKYNAALWLGIIECDAGHHQAELAHARRLVALQPRDHRSLEALRHAAACNGLRSLEHEANAALGEALTPRQERRANAALKALQDASDPREDHPVLLQRSTPPLLAPTAPSPRRPHASPSAEALGEARRLWGRR